MFKLDQELETFVTLKGACGKTTTTGSAKQKIGPKSLLSFYIYWNLMDDEDN
jgi:hypothetical protein